MIDEGRTDRLVEPLRQAVKTVAGLNLIYFGIEFAVALAIGSVSLFADSIDFLEDAAVNALILLALGWSTQRRALVGMAMAAILLVPGAATAWMAWQKFILPVRRRRCRYRSPAPARSRSTCSARSRWLVSA